MKTVTTALAAGALLTAVSALGAQAMPLPGADALGASAEVTRVAGGCGPGFRPAGPYGRCVPFRGGYGYGGPRYFGGGYGGPRCFFREGPFGPRRICRY